MNIPAILKKEGIEIKSKLKTEQVKQIASIISEKMCETFPEHNLQKQNLFSSLTNLDMYVAKMPLDSGAKYFSQNHAIYFNSTINFKQLDTLVFHECLHAIQEIKNENGKLLRLGLYHIPSNKGQGINEASVQFMASKATHTKNDSVKYYNMDFHTESPLYYPIETALIKQLIYFTGSYPLFHSTLYSNDIFKNTLIAKCGKKFYHTLEYNFDLLIYYEQLLADFSSSLSNCCENSNKQKKLNHKIETVKSLLLEITLSTQNLIIENCFQAEFNLVKDQLSLNQFQKKLYDFHELLITTPCYQFYNSFYCEMMNQLEEKREFIKTYGDLNYFNNMQKDLLDLQKVQFGFQFFRKLFDKLKLLLEEAIRQKD